MDFDPNAYVQSAPETAQQPTQPQGFDPEAYAQSTSQAATAEPTEFNPEEYIGQKNQEQYGTGEQQIKAGLEGALRGVVSAPIASAAEKALGVDPEAILGRQEANPWTAGIGEAAGFAGSSFIPVVGQAGLIGKLGNAAVHGAEIAGVGSKLAQGAIRLGSEMAVLGGLDQTSRMILDDPEQSATSALKNIGLSAALGGLTGGALKGTGMLAKAAAEKADLPAGLKSFLERLKARAGGVNDAELLGHEIQDTAGKYNNLGSELTGPNGLKESVIKQSMPESTLENNEIVHKQVVSISDNLSNEIEKAKNNPYLSSAVPKLEFHQRELLAAVQDPAATSFEKFKALNGLKQDLDQLTRYGTTAEDSAFGKVAKKISGEIRAGLEDSKVWGKAADVQKEVNAAWTKALPAVKDIQSKFFTNGILDQAKLQSYLNQNGKATSQTVRQQMLGKYADAMDHFQNTVEGIHQKLGLTNPHEPMSMNAIKDSLQKPNPWARAADAWYDKKLSKAAGETAGAAIGGTMGSAVPIPGAGWAGALLGGHIGEHLLPSIIQPMLESPISVKAFAASGNLMKNMIEGDKAMTSAASGLFGNAGKTVPQNFQFKDTEKLDKQLKSFQQNPKQAADMAVNTPNYLQQHQQHLHTTAANAASYLNSQRPVPKQLNPLDTPIQPTKAEHAAFEHKLELAQNPLSIMKNVKDGSIQASDIAALNAMYPKLIPNLAQKTTEAMVDHVHKGGTIPYETKMGLSILLGQPVDSTMTPQSIQAAQPKPQMPQQGQAKGSGKSMKALNKTANSYRTPGQTAEKDRSDRD